MELIDQGDEICCEYILLPLANKEPTFSQWLNRIQPVWKRYRETVGRASKMSFHYQEIDTSARPHWNFASRPQPHGDAKINDDGLVQDIRASQICLSYWPNSIANNTVSE